MKNILAFISLFTLISSTQAQSPFLDIPNMLGRSRDEVVDYFEKGYPDDWAVLGEDIHEKYSVIDYYPSLGTINKDGRIILLRYFFDGKNDFRCYLYGAAILNEFKSSLITFLSNRYERLSNSIWIDYKNQKVYEINPELQNEKAFFLKIYNNL